MDRGSIIATLISGFLPGWVYRLARHAHSALSTVLWWISPQDVSPPEPEPEPEPVPAPVPATAPAPAPAPLIVHLSDESIAKVKAAVREALDESSASVIAEQIEIVEILNWIERLAAGQSFTVSLHGTAVREEAD
ncbi:hypothetical protein HRR90_006102 [Exophiala dermatitidis]|nr:hypothetical protein HRR90_006102 [Exophiala dermatitidis]